MIEQSIRKALVECPGVQEIRGRGAMLGIVLTADFGAEVVAAARELGLITNSPLPNVLRIVPPLTISDTELEMGIEILKQAVAQVIQVKS
jgi:acetylornithine aminotransferase